MIRTLFFLLAVLIVPVSNATTQLFTFSNFVGSYSPSVAACPINTKNYVQGKTAVTCNEARAALDQCLVDQGKAMYWLSSGCSADPVIVGTKIYLNGSTSNYVTAATSTTVCPTGQRFDTATLTCVYETAQNISSCLPSIRTIAPCPSGFAPANAIPLGSKAPDPYVSNYDTLPLQDMLYAIGMIIAGLFGFGIGTRLI